MAIDSIKTLREKLVLEEKADGNLSELFYELAEALLCKFVIRKNEKVYHIRTVEFYWYSDNHRDIITYPRNCEEGMWFFHASGVDLSFRSHVDTVDIKVQGKKKAERTIQKPVFNGNDARFGGILIRCISDSAGNTYNGPQLVVNELFDKFNALGPDDLPILEYCPSRDSGIPVEVEREGLAPSKWDEKDLADKNILIEDKIHKISSNYCNPDDVKADKDLVKCYMDFIDAKYAYTNLGTNSHK